MTTDEITLYREASSRASECGRALWVQTRSGRAVDLLGTLPEQINAYDIADQIARAPRFNGCTIDDLDAVYSVASHSVLVAALLPFESSPAMRLAALLHDCHEAYAGDTISPIKWTIEALLAASGCALDPIAIIHASLQAAIHAAVGLHFDPAWHASIKAADLQALALESKHMMAAPPRPWKILPPVDTNTAIRPMAVPASWARRTFLGRLRTLITEAGVTPLPTFWAKP